jgi:hypothetical protein
MSQHGLSLYTAHAVPAVDAAEPSVPYQAGTTRTASVESVDEDFAPTMHAADLYR